MRSFPHFRHIDLLLFSGTRSAAPYRPITLDFFHIGMRSVKTEFISFYEHLCVTNVCSLFGTLQKSVKFKKINKKNSKMLDFLKIRRRWAIVAPLDSQFTCKLTPILHKNEHLFVNFLYKSKQKCVKIRKK